ncbi:MAG: thioesterase family protein [Gammaproteobacteria bacterium]
MQRTDFKHVIELAIRWGDMDALGHVNNVQYFRYLESGRIAYFSDRAPLEYKAVAQLVLADMQCRFLRQLHYPGVLEIATRVARLGNSSLQVEAAIFMKGEPAPAATAHAILVWFDFASGRSAPLPSSLRQALAVFEGIAPGP